MTPWIVGLISIVVSTVLSLSGSIAVIAFSSGKQVQGLDDHTASDERRFSEISAMLTEMRADIKELLKHG